MDTSDIDLLSVQQIIEYLYDNFCPIVIYLSQNLHEVCDQIPGLSKKMKYPVNPLFHEIAKEYDTDTLYAACELVFNIIIPLHKYIILLKAINSPKYSDFLSEIYVGDSGYIYSGEARKSRRLLLEKFNICDNPVARTYGKSLEQKFSESFRKTGWDFAELSRCSATHTTITFPIPIDGYEDGFATPEIQDYKPELDGVPLTAPEILENIMKYPYYINLLAGYLPNILPEVPVRASYNELTNYATNMIITIIAGKNLWPEFDVAIRKCEFGRIIGRLPKPDLTAGLLVPLKSCLLVSQFEPDAKNITETKIQDTKPSLEPECCICYEVKPRLAGKECGHRCICRECSVFFLECPICNCTTGWIQIYES